MCVRLLGMVDLVGCSMIAPSRIDLIRTAYHTAFLESDDNDTHVGALLINEGWLISSANRLPDNVERIKERLRRPNKYKWIEHAERGVIFRAASEGFVTRGATMVAPWAACPDCARAIVCAGISELVVHGPARNKSPKDWAEQMAIGDEILKEGGVKLTVIDDQIGNCHHQMRGIIWHP